MTGRRGKLLSNSLSTAGTSAATVAAAAASSSRDRAVSTRSSAAPLTSAKSIPAISRVRRGVGSGVARGVGIGAAVGATEGSADSVLNASGDDDGESLGRVAGPHAAKESRSTETRRALTERSLPTRWPAGPDFAVVQPKRYDFHGGQPCPRAV